MAALDTALREDQAFFDDDPSFFAPVPPWVSFPIGP